LDGSPIRTRLNVRFGSKADMCSATRDVRFGPIADIGVLFDYLVGACEQ
jgi:hypothetical protein